MENEEKEILDSETQDNVGDDVTTKEVEETSSETEESTGGLEKATKVAEDQKRRAEKAEAKLKELKAQMNDEKTEPKTEGQKVDEAQAKPTGDSLSKEEAILYARGLSEDEVEKIKSIAKLEESNPLAAAESDYFTIWKDKKDKAKETQETQLGASRGSAKVTPKKDIGTPGISSDEHRNLWKKQMGR